MVLYDVRGNSFPIDAREWSAALSMALKFGWKPAGTLSPPVHVEGVAQPRWNGSYDVPAGQAVTREDAAALASALASAMEHSAIRSTEPLIAFCRRSAFVICEERADAAQDLLALAAAVGQATPIKQRSAEPASV